MTALSAFELQKAVDTALMADGTLMGKISDVYSNPEQEEDVSFPFLVIGDHVSSDWSSKTFDGSEIVTTNSCVLEIWR